jgi:2'-5' RNA ligase
VSGERARLFVALELPEEVREALAGWRVSALGGADGVRAVALDDLHVTLCFLGWRGLADVEAIAGACEVVRGRGAVELGLGEAVALPQRRPRVLAVSLDDRDGGLAAAQWALAGALEGGGWYAPEQRPHYGHVTVARVGRGARLPRTALVGPAPPPVRFHGTDVALYRSHLRRSGASYESLARVPLS